MTPIDHFAKMLLEESKRFLEKASDSPVDSEAQSAYLHSALLLSVASLEAHVASIGEDFKDCKEFTVHERAILLERDVGLNSGQFKLSKSLKMVRLEDRIEFVVRKFSGRSIDRNAAWWGNLKVAIQLRNELTHPKGVPSLSTESVGRAIEAVIGTVDVMYIAVYKASFPAKRRALQSRMHF